MIHHIRTLARALSASVACAALLGPIAPRTAVAEEGFRDPRSLGMGDAFVVGNSNGSIYHNPAGIHSAPVYSLQTGYQFSDANNGSSLSASIVDAKTNPFISAGAAYSFSVGNGGSGARLDDVRDHNVRVALAAPIVPRYLSLGVGMHYANVRSGWDTLEDEPLRSKGIGFHSGLLGTYEGRFSAGFSAQNIFTTGDLDRPRRFTTGVGVFVGPVHIEAQHVTAERIVVGDRTGPNIGLDDSGDDGVEYGQGFNAGIEVNAGPVPLRLGIAREPSTEQMWIGAGLGYRNPVVGFDAGFRQNLASGFSNDRQFAVALLFFL